MRHVARPKLCQCGWVAPTAESTGAGPRHEAGLIDHGFGGAPREPLAQVRRGQPRWRRRVRDGAPARRARCRSSRSTWPPAARLSDVPVAIAPELAHLTRRRSDEFTARGVLGGVTRGLAWPGAHCSILRAPHATDLARWRTRWSLVFFDRRPRLAARGQHVQRRADAEDHADRDADLRKYGDAEVHGSAVRSPPWRGSELPQ